MREPARNTCTTGLIDTRTREGSVADNGSGGYYGYRASKAAVNAIGKSLAVDLRPRGIAVALLHPGYVSTDMVGGRGDVNPTQAATQLVARLDALTLEHSGSFWHASGSTLPWVTMYGPTAAAPKPPRRRLSGGPARQRSLTGS